MNHLGKENSFSFQRTIHALNEGLKLIIRGGRKMSENKKQTELEQLIKVELLGIITRIAELAAKKVLDEDQEEFITLLKSIMDNQIAFAWGITKLLNELDKKTPQDVRDQEELVKVTMQIDGKQIAEVITQR